MLTLLSPLRRLEHLVETSVKFLSELLFRVGIQRAFVSYAGANQEAPSSFLKVLDDEVLIVRSLTRNLNFVLLISVARARGITRQ